MNFPDGTIKEGYFDNNIFRGPAPEDKPAEGSSKGSQSGSPGGRSHYATNPEGKTTGDMTRIANPSTEDYSKKFFIKSSSTNLLRKARSIEKASSNTPAPPTLSRVASPGGANSKKKL